jgi:hypothetical protein
VAPSKECPNCRLASPGTAAFCACGWDFETGAMRVRAARPRPARPQAPEPEHEERLAAAPESDEPAPLWRRVFLLPFLPPLWARAAGWRLLQVAVPVLLLAFLLDGALAGYRSLGIRGDLRSMAHGYDAAYPAVIVEGGKVRVEGDGVIQWVDGNTTFLVDPRETIPLERIATSEYLVVRETQIIRKQGFRTETTQVKDLQPLIGERLRFDSQFLRAFEAKWGGTIQAGMVALMWVFMLIGDLLCLVYVAAAAGLALALRGRSAGLGYGACFRAALATYSLVVVLSTLLSLLGHGTGFCVSVWLWPLLMTGLATWAVSRAGDAMSPARHF